VFWTGIYFFSLFVNVIKLCNCVLNLKQGKHFNSMHVLYTTALNLLIKFFSFDDEQYISEKNVTSSPGL
jgi:hypothetical protein